MAMFAFALPDELAARFDAAFPGARSRKLRDLVATATGETTPAEAPARRGRSIKVTVRLKADELAALDTASGADGLRRSEWVLAVLRRRLFGKPRFGRAEELAFYQVQEELRRIGVNLNQIARAVNTAVMPGQVLDLELQQIEAARAEIRAHVLGLRAAFQGNLDYWDDAP